MKRLTKLYPFYFYALSGIETCKIVKRYVIIIKVFKFFGGKYEKYD